MVTATAAQLIRIARLQRFVGVFARGGDREATAEALAELSRASRAGGLPGDALKRAREAAQLFADDDTSEAGIRTLIQLSGACLQAGEADASAQASEVAHARALALAEPLRSELVACAALLGGIASSMLGEVDAARAWLDEARDRFAAANHPEGAALALTQQGLLDVSAGLSARAQVCFAFARDFYRSGGQVVAAAEIAALAARAFADMRWDEALLWFRGAIAEADIAGSSVLAAELIVELGAELERRGALAEAAVIAAEGAQRCAALAEPVRARELVLRARLQLARLTDDPTEALRHLDAAFELALDQRDAAALGAAMEVVVSGLVRARFADVGWKLVDRFRERLSRGGFADLAEAAMVALEDLRA